jgi:serine/threonine-protein kinase
MSWPILAMTEEERRYLQRRIGLYARVSFGVIAAFLLLDLVSWPFVLDVIDPAMTEMQTQSILAEAALAGLLLVAVLVVRRGRPSAVTLYTFDGLATLVVTTGLALVVHSAPGNEMPFELIAFLAIQLLLFVHAALVPAPPVRTVIVHVLACVPILLAAVDRAHRYPGQGLLETWSSTWSIVVYTVAFSAVGGILSWVLYGLRVRIREAMRLGEYRLEKKLGEGGMGVVYRAQHALLRRPTAVKLLPPAKLGEETVARFEREVRQTSRLTHPNTVAIYDFGRTPDGIFYYAMELLDGLDLAKIVELDGPMPAPRVVHILRQCAGALAEAHGLDLVHRDVKPENVILCKRRGGVPDVVKVVDFGLVKDLERSGDAGLSRDDVLTGTPLFLPPEAVTRPNEIDCRADLYSLGATAFFLLCGRPPFEGRTIVEVCAKHLSEPPTAPSKVSPHQISAALDSLVLRLLAKDPADRFESATALEDALARCPEDGGWSRADAEAWWAACGEKLQPAADSQAVSAPETLTVAVARRALTR